MKMAPSTRLLQVLAPLFVGAGLIVLFVVLIIRHGASNPAPPGAVQPALETAGVEDPRMPVSLKEIPRAAPLEKDLTPRPEQKGVKRWKIDPLPEGWNQEIAARLADLFNRIHFDPYDPDSFLQTGPALEELEKFLLELGPDSLPTLAAILNAEPFAPCRRRLLLTIGGFGKATDDATFVLRDFFTARRSNYQSRVEMNYCIDAMGKLQNGVALETMAQMIEDPGMETFYRDKFIQALGDHERREEKKGLLVEMMRSSTDVNIRNHSAQALGKIASPQLLPDLMESYNREPHWIAQQTILGSMGKTGDPSALPFLEEVARTSPKDGLRLSAANAINRIGTPEARTILKDLSQTESNPQVKVHMLKWVNGGVTGSAPASPITH